MSRQSVIRIPSLHGGISQQSPAIRHVHQVEDAENALFSVYDGCTKRPGTFYAGKILGLSVDTAYRIHEIQRDEDEEYLVLYGSAGLLRVFEIDGSEATVGITADATTYLTANSPTPDQLRLITIADATFIVNTTVEVALESTPDFSINLTSAPINRQPTYSALIAITVPNESYFQVPQIADDTEYDYYQYTPESDITYCYVICDQVNGTSHARPTPYLTREGGAKIGFGKLDVAATSVAWTDATKTITKAGAFADYTFESGDMLYIASGTHVTAGWYEIASKTDDDSIVMVDAIASPTGDESDWAITAIGDEYEIIVDFSDGTYDTMHDIAAAFQSALQGAGATGALIGYREINVNSKGHFVITSPYRGADATLITTAAPGSDYDYSQNLAALDIGAATVVAGTGDAGSDQTGESASERWTQVAPPNSDNARFTRTTMPVKLERTSVSSGGTPAQFSCDVVTWDDRLRGNETTNPAPSLFSEGKKISDMSIHRGRIVVAGDEYVVFSQAGDLFNFWIDDPSTIVDSDPIEAPIGSTKVAIIDFITPFRQSLLIHTKVGQQFELGTPDRLTNDTVNIAPATSIQTLSVRPESLGDICYFVGRSSDGKASLIEYVYSEDRVANYANNVSRHVPTLLPTTIRKIVVDNASNTVFLLVGDGTTIYVYRTHWEGVQKQQSAWTKYEFDSSYKILDIAAIDNNLYMLVQSASQFIIEVIPIEDDASPCPPNSLTSNSSSGGGTSSSSPASSSSSSGGGSSSSSSEEASSSSSSEESSSGSSAACENVYVKMNYGGSSWPGSLGAPSEPSVGARVRSVTKPANDLGLFVQSFFADPYDPTDTSLALGDPWALWMEVSDWSGVDAFIGHMYEWFNGSTWNNYFESHPTDPLTQCVTT